MQFLLEKPNLFLLLLFSESENGNNVARVYRENKINTKKRKKKKQINEIENSLAGQGK